MWIFKLEDERLLEEIKSSTYKRLSVEKGEQRCNDATMLSLFRMKTVLSKWTSYVKNSI